MTKRILFGLIICSLIFALFITSQRISLEQENQTIEFVADLQDFVELVNPDLTLDSILEQFSILGVTKVALSETTAGEKLVANPDDSYANYPLAEILNEPVGFRTEEIDLLKRWQLQPVPKVLAGEHLNFTLDEKLHEFETSMVIFSGNQVIGYPDGLNKTAEIIKDKKLILGLVEFSEQKGMTKVADATDVVRIHAINKSEMNTLSKERILNRFLRAVRERNIRVIYLRPFQENWEQTVELIQDLANALSKAGYTLGHASPYPQWQPGIFSIWICILGVLAATGFLVQRFILFSEKILWLCLLFAGSVGLLGLNFNQVLMQQGFALLAAIVFPTLAVMNYNYFENRVFKNYLTVSVISLTGGILVTGLLSSTAFLIKLVEFRGVKLMHLLPVLLMFVYGLFKNYLPIKSLVEFKLDIKKLWNFSIPVKYLVGVIIVSGVAGIYILRTGNFGLPIMELEIKFREALEHLLIVRPRTKEFLIGHPSLFLLLVTRKPHPLLLSVAAIGQLSLINTFTHIHTPVLLSILRCFYGLLIGYVIGWLVYQGYQNIKRRLANDSRFRVLRLPK